MITDAEPRKGLKAALLAKQGGKAVANSASLRGSKEHADILVFQGLMQDLSRNQEQGQTITALARTIAVLLQLASSWS